MHVVARRASHHSLGGPLSFSPTVDEGVTKIQKDLY